MQTNIFKIQVATQHTTMRDINWEQPIISKRWVDNIDTKITEWQVTGRKYLSFDKNIHIHRCTWHSPDAWHKRRKNPRLFIIRVSETKSHIKISYIVTYIENLIKRKKKSRKYLPAKISTPFTSNTHGTFLVFDVKGCKNCRLFIISSTKSYILS